MWVLKEVILAPAIHKVWDDDESKRNILIEDDVISFDELHKAISTIGRERAQMDLVHHDGNRRGCKGYSSTLTLAKHRLARCSRGARLYVAPADVLADALTFESTDPRDKIFALGGLSKNPNSVLGRNLIIQCLIQITSSL